MIIAGLGFASKATVNDILKAVEVAALAHDLDSDDIGLVATIEEKRTSTALEAAARKLGVPLDFAQGSEMDQVSGKLMTRSEKSLENTGSASVSEAAALAFAGTHGELLGPRIIKGPVTCALARTDDRDKEEINS